MLSAQASALLRRLTKRAEFLRAARGRRASRPGLMLQTAKVEHLMPGIGFTVTKKTGNAVVRNRIKRRLRAAAAQCADKFHPHHDYVLIGRREALSEPFERLVGSLEGLIVHVHANRKSAKRT